MPNRQTPAKLSLLVAACATVVFIPALIPPPAARACPVEPPSPLRKLYHDGDLVAVVRVGDTTPAGSDKEPTATREQDAVDDQGGMVKTALLLSKTLKGESRERVVSLYHYQGADEVDERYSKGTRLLVFLSKLEDGGYSPTDYRYSIKLLSEDALKIYVRRIEELSAITGREKPDTAEIVEWLVRCAEEPATRWEGAYELASNVSVPMSAEADDEDAAPSPGGQGENESPSDGDARQAQDQSVDPSVLEADKGVEGDADFAPLLTTAQKERLARALFDAEQLGEGEYTLLPLVAMWGDARLVPFLLRQLQTSADKPPYESETVMTLAARALGDKTLIKFAADYVSRATYDDTYDDGAEEGGAGDDARKQAEERRAAAAEALTYRSSKVYQFLALAQQPQKPADRRD